MTFRKPRSLFMAFWVVIVLLFSQGLFAAQSGRVENDTEVYDLPSTKGKSLERVKKDAALEVSNLPTQNFYKVRTPRGTIGWVNSEDLRVEFTEDAFKSKAPDKKKESTKPKYKSVEKLDQYFKVGVFGGLALFPANGIINQLGNIGPGYSMGAEMGYFVKAGVLILIRVEQIFKNQFVYDTISRDNIQLTVKSFPLEIGCQVNLLNWAPFSLYATALGGVANKTTVVSTSEITPTVLSNIQNLSSNNVTALGKLDIYWMLSRHLSVFGELGYRYLKSSQFTPVIENGSIFTQSFQLNLSGTVLGLGMSYSF
jgi:hypothetical protein